MTEVWVVFQRHEESSARQVDVCKRRWRIGVRRSACNTPAPDKVSVCKRHFRISARQCACNTPAPDNTAWEPGHLATYF